VRDPTGRMRMQSHSARSCLPLATAKHGFLAVFSLQKNA